MNPPRPVFQQKLLLSTLTSIFLIFAVLLVEDAEAQFAARFSLSVGEEYNDNIFFSKNKEHDFITFITPTLTFLYTPDSEKFPTFTLNISPSGQIFARHSELNNFGENLSLDGAYTYRYTPRLTFHVWDTLQRRGDTRTTGVGREGAFELPEVRTSPPFPGRVGRLSPSEKLGDFLSTGDTLANHFSIQGRFLYAPNVTFSSGYSLHYTNLLDQGGNEFFHSIDVIRGIYTWREVHNLHAGYSIGIIKSRNGDDNVVHNIDLGDDYFTAQKIQLTPTLTLSASTGVSLLTGTGGTRIINNSQYALMKVWETATLTAGVRKGVTGSFGISGPSDTTTLFTAFNSRLTERLTGVAGVDFSLFDTDDVNFNTFRAHAGFQYTITSWLCSTLRYSHRRLHSGAGARNTDLLTRGNVNGNSAFLVFSAHFDIWPSLGLAKGPSCPVGVPPVAPPPAPSFQDRSSFPSAFIKSHPMLQGKDSPLVSLQ